MATQASNAVAPKVFITQRVQMMMGILSLQFVLGMLLNTIGEPDSSTSHSVNILWHVILGAHVLVGILLLASAAYILSYAAKNYREMSRTATVSLVAIVFAVIFGSLTARDVARELMSFLMAMSFLIAISTYGRSLHQ